MSMGDHTGRGTSWLVAGALAAGLTGCGVDPDPASLLTDSATATASATESASAGSDGMDTGMVIDDCGCFDTQKCCVYPGDITMYCYPVSNPETGCGEDFCSRCPDDIPNAVPACAGTACSFACLDGFGDCDGDSNNGCENTLDSAQACGACGVVCEGAAVAAPRCADPDPFDLSWHCEIDACSPGFEDCNEEFADGCEAEIATDDGHCGGCFNPCETGTTCENSQCVGAADNAIEDVTDDIVDLGSPSYACRIALTADNVLFTTGSDVRRVAKAGGFSQTLHTPTATPAGVATDGSELFASSGDGIVAIDLSNLQPRTLVDTMAAGCMVADGLDLFYTSSSVGQEGVWSVPIAGGTPTQVATAAVEPRCVDTTSTFVVWLAGTAIEWTDKTTPATPLVADIVNASNGCIVAQESMAFYSQYDGVGRATFLDQSTLSLAQFVSGELGGGGDNPVAAAAADAAADDGSTVWSATSHDDGAVFEIAVATGGLTTLVTTRGAVDLAVDASHLYALGNGRVWRLPR